MNKRHQLVFYVSELKQCEFIMDNDDIESRIALFLFKYVSIEAFYKKLLIAKKESDGIKLTKKQKQNLNVYASEVTGVLEFFNVNHDKDLIERIFGSNDDNYKECSIKKLRNRLVHNLNENVLRIILERYEQLNRDMDCFLNLFS